MIQCNNEIAIWARSFNKKGVFPKIYYQSDYTSSKCKSKFSFNLRNAPPDSKCKDWIEGKVLKTRMSGGNTVYWEVDKTGGTGKAAGAVGVGGPGWIALNGKMHITPPIAGLRALRDNCSATFYWVASYENYEDAKADINCVAKKETVTGSGTNPPSGNDDCNECVNGKLEPCPLPPPTDPPPPPVQPTPKIRCKYKWEAEWSCLTRKVTKWNFAGRACNNNRPWFEWICVEQSRLDNDWKCKLEYYTYGNEFVPINPAHLCDHCSLLWYADYKQPIATRNIALMGKTWTSLWMDQYYKEPHPSHSPSVGRIPPGHKPFWPKEWPAQYTIKKGNFPCKCKKHFKLTLCEDCLGNEEDGKKVGGKWPKIVFSAHDLLTTAAVTRNSVVAVWKEANRKPVCVTVTAIQTPDDDAVIWGKEATLYLQSWKPWGQDQDHTANCDSCMGGHVLARVRCDVFNHIVDLPALVAKKPADPNSHSVFDWSRVTTAEAEELIKRRLLEYTTFDVKGTRGTEDGRERQEWVEDKLPMVFLEDNVCWRLQNVSPCPTAWVRSKAKTEVTRRHEIETINDEFNHELRDQTKNPPVVIRRSGIYDDIHSRTITSWSSPDDDCKKCLTDHTCPKLKRLYCQTPRDITLLLSAKCINPKQPNCKCTSVRLQRPFNKRVKVAPMDKGESLWKMTAEAYGGDSNDRVHWYWLWRDKGDDIDSWRPLYTARFLNDNVAGSIGKCLGMPQVVIKDQGVAELAGKYPKGIGGGPLIKDKWKTTVSVNWFAEDGSIEFVPLPFTCPCEKWKAGTRLNADGVPIYPRMSNCDCPKDFPAHPIRIAKGLGNDKQSYCADPNVAPTNSSMHIPFVGQLCHTTVTDQDRPPHVSNVGVQVQRLFFSPRGGNCDADDIMHPWSVGITDQQAKHWCKDCSETATHSQHGLIGRWFCGAGFLADETQTNKGRVGGAWVKLNQAPYNCKWGQTIVGGSADGSKIPDVSTSCCYKLTNISTNMGTYGSTVYNNYLWYMPRFHLANHSHFLRGKGVAYRENSSRSPRWSAANDPYACAARDETTQHFHCR